MKKQFRKQVVIGIACTLGVALAAAAFIIWGMGVNKWIRYITIAVLTAGFFGFLLYIFGGWQGFFSGAKYGAAFVAITIAGQELPFWAFGIMIIIAVTFFIVRPLIKQYKLDREKNSGKVIDKKAAAQIRLEESAGKEEREAEDEFKKSICFGGKSLIVLAGSGGMYQLIKGAAKLYFVRIGGEVSGMDPELLITDFSDESKYIKGKKDFFIAPEDILEIKFKAGKVNRVPVDSCGKLSIVTKDKRYSYAVLGRPSQKSLEAYFAGLPFFFTGKPKKRASAYLRSLTEQERKILPVIKKIGLVLIASSFIFAAAFLFLPFDRITYRIFSAACMIIPAVTFILYLKYNKLLSLDDSKDSTFRKNGVNITIPILAPSAVLLIRTLLDSDILGWRNLLILSALIAAAVLFLFFRFTKEYRHKKSIAFLIVMAVLFYAPSAAVQINCLYDFSAPEIKTTPLLDKDVSESRNGDTYHFKVQLGDGSERKLKVTEEFYKERDTGDFVTVVEKQGLLGINYVYIDEDE